MAIERLRTDCRAVDRFIDRLIELELPLPDGGSREGELIALALEHDGRRVLVRTRRGRLRQDRRAGRRDAQGARCRRLARANGREPRGLRAVAVKSTWRDGRSASVTSV